MKRYTENEITKRIKRKKQISLVLKIIFYPLIIILLLCNIWLSIQKINKPNKIPSLFGYRAFNIATGSMEPTLNIGDMIIIKEEPEKIKINDIITFKESGSTITHRVISIINENEIKYQTKGDANSSADKELVTTENLQGKFVFKIGKVGGLISNARNATTIVIIIIVAYTIYTIISKKEDRKIARHEKRKEYEKNTK